MTTRDTIEGILAQWGERHGLAPETPQALLDAYRAEVLGEAERYLVKKYGVTNRAAGELRRMATEGPDV